MRRVADWVCVASLIGVLFLAALIYDNRSQWIGFGGSGGAGGGLFVISTQTASNSASLQFTNLPTSYNTLLVNCSGIVPATGGVSFVIQYGEGATPTWETANYTWSEYGHSATTGFSNNGSSSDSSIAASAPNDVSNTYPLNLVGYINNVSSSTLEKGYSGHVNYMNNSAHFADAISSGTYSGDTNPVTAIQLSFSSGNITSGACSLYGMN